LLFTRADGIIPRVTSKNKNQHGIPPTQFEIRESLGLEDWDAPDTEHLVLHMRHPTHPDWAVSAAFEVRATHAVLTGVFVRPVAEWSPPGGLTLEVVRSIKLDDLRKRATDRLRTRDVAGYLGIDPTKVQEPKRRGRKGRTDLDYARLARRYVALLDHAAPVKILSKQMKLNESTVRVLIYEARQHGLLTPGAPGRAGGKLTDKAQRILAAAGDDEHDTPQAVDKTNVRRRKS
jgi:hypothetical protein